MPPHRPRRGRRALRIALLAVLIVAMAFLSMLAGAYVSVARTLPSLELADRMPSPETTKIYDSSPIPVLLAELHGLENRRALSGDQIPQVMRDATVAVEDPRFYEHKGMDFFGILRAGWAKFRHREVAAGGSAITQQLIKNAFLTDEQSAADPTLEPTIAYQLESRWTKEKILNEYLNFVYFGSGAYGIQAAAVSYFGVDAKDLTLAQAALLAGLPRSPSVYSPRRDPAAAIARRNAVLNKMYQQRFVSSDQLQAALEEPLRLADPESQGEAAEACWVDLVREQLIARYGSSTVLGGGLRVYVSFNTALQEAAHKAIDDALAQAAGLTAAPGAASPGEQPLAPSVALVAIEVDSARLLAMVGATHPSTRQINLATQGRFKTGPAFQPFVVAAAFAQGVSPEATYPSGSASMPLPTGTATVASTDEGPLTLATALARSSKGVFARVANEIGAGPVARMAADMGITGALTDSSPIIAAAGPSAGVTPLEMALAYASLASGGERRSARVTFDPSKAGYPVSIVRVTGADGELLDENGTEEARVLDRGIAEMVTASLRGVITSGTGPAGAIGRPAAGMTGVSEDGTSAWFVGYTPELVTAVWVGYPDDSADGSARLVSLIGSTLPEQIWAAFMSAALAGTPASDFSVANSAKWVSIDVCSESRLLPTELCPSVVKRLFRVDDGPVDTCRLHVPQAVFMPNVVGMSISGAKTALAEAKLKVKTISDNGSTKPAGVVTRQDQPAGKPVLQGTEIVLHVSAGKMVSVPKLAGLTLEEAQARLAAAGLVAEVAQQPSDTVPANFVISQDPASGRTVSRGSTVRIVVSSGPVTPPSTPPST